MNFIFYVELVGAQLRKEGEKKLVKQWWIFPSSLYKSF